MPVVKLTKKEVGGYCTECRARFSQAQLQEMIRHTGRTGHITRWRELRESEIRPDGRDRKEMPG